MAFVLGDALGAPFEFRTPLLEELNERWLGHESVFFTDDTYLLLSSLCAIHAGRLTDQPDWSGAREAALVYLLEWIRSDDLRGIGLTTRAALSQLERHIENDGEWSTFKLERSSGYDFSNSAGNGILSRALPLILAGLRPDQNFRSFLELTHLHPDGHDSVDWMHASLIDSKRSGKLIKRAAKGFWSIEALVIAELAIGKATTSREAFILSQRPGGDNDSTAALALAMWVWEHGWDMELDQLLRRLDERDSARIMEVGLV